MLIIFQDESEALLLQHHLQQQQRGGGKFEMILYLPLLTLCFTISLLIISALYKKPSGHFQLSSLCLDPQYRVIYIFWAGNQCERNSG